jgi:hypothetical protein
MIVALMALGAAACAGSSSGKNSPFSIRSEPENPPIQARAFALPAVGGVIPVFVSISYPDLSFMYPPFIERKDIYASGGGAGYVQALPLADVETRAGVAPKLAPLLTNMTDDQAVDYYLQARPTELNRGLARGFVQKTFDIALAQAARSNYESAQRIKLEVIALPESAGQRGPGPGQVSWNNGWVFFPLGRYTELRVDIHRMRLQHFAQFGQPEDLLIEERKLPWSEQPIHRID